ncbi:MAG: hypothetical protein AAB874_08215, partial [Patescibacteria group bacterium]
MTQLSPEASGVQKLTRWAGLTAENTQPISCKEYVVVPGLNPRYSNKNFIVEAANPDGDASRYTQFSFPFRNSDKELAHVAFQLAYSGWTDRPVAAAEMLASDRVYFTHAGQLTSLEFRGGILTRGVQITRG